MGNKSKILIVGNVPTSAISKKLFHRETIGGGWIDSIVSLVSRSGMYTVCYVFPSTRVSKLYSDSVDGVSFYIIPAPKTLGLINAIDPTKTTKKLSDAISELLAIVKPDLLHVFGSEFAHAAEIILQYAKPNRTILHVQGISRFLGNHYCDGIPWYVKHMVVPSTIVTGTLSKQKKRFISKRTRNESVAMNGAAHITGRTDWDHACVGIISPRSKYHYIGESLRDAFYSGTWHYSDCEQCSIYISQVSSTFKGFHYFLPALLLLVKRYPKCKVYVAGREHISGNGLGAAMRRSSYACYLRRLIKKYRLENNITFLGPLDAEEVKEHLLKVNVFVSSSIIENSPNSLGEAMLLGVPCVASDVGGTASMLVHEQEGYLYQCNAPYMLAYYVSRIFEMKDRVEYLCSAAKKHAESTHDRMLIISSILKLYAEVLSEDI